MEEKKNMSSSEKSGQECVPFLVSISSTLGNESVLNVVTALGMPNQLRG